MEPAFIFIWLYSKTQLTLPKMKRPLDFKPTTTIYHLMLVISVTIVTENPKIFSVIHNDLTYTRTIAVRLEKQYRSKILNNKLYRPSSLCHVWFYPQILSTAVNVKNDRLKLIWRYFPALYCQCVVGYSRLHNSFLEFL